MEMEESEVTILADNVCVPKCIAQSYQLSAPLNNISTDMTDEATGSGKNIEHAPEIEVLCEVLRQSQTVSRDSGCSTPFPMVGNFGAKDNQKVGSVREGVSQCVICEKSAGMQRSGCLVTCYCSEKCQLEDWNATHHLVCCASLDECCLQDL